jgi:hypothetical protein
MKTRLALAACFVSLAALSGVTLALTVLEMLP